MARQKAWSEVEISAYLDGALDAQARQALEATMARDDDLRGQVDGLREVVALVRAAPLREPPRNYLLTPGMVAETVPARKTPRRTPLLLMRLATSLTAVAFVVTVGLNFLSRGTSPAMVTRNHAEPGAQVAVTAQVERAVEAPAMEAAPEEKAAELPPPSQPELESAPLQALEAPAEGVGGGGGVPEPAPMAAMVVTPTLEAAKAPGDTGEAPPEGLRAMALPETVTETTLSDETVLDTAPKLATGEDTETLTTTVHPLTYVEEQAGDTKSGLRFSELWLPGTLGLATLILAGVTFWMSRRR